LVRRALQLPLALLLCKVFTWRSVRECNYVERVCDGGWLALRHPHAVYGRHQLVQCTVWAVTRGKCPNLRFRGTLHRVDAHVRPLHTGGHQWPVPNMQLKQCEDLPDADQRLSYGHLQLLRHDGHNYVANGGGERPPFTTAHSNHNFNCWFVSNSVH